MARKGTTTFNGKTGVWRTVGGRRIFIATGQSLEDAMRESGKFDNIGSKSKDKSDDYKGYTYEELGKKVSTIQRELRRDDLDAETKKELKNEMADMQKAMTKADFGYGKQSKRAKDEEAKNTKKELNKKLDKVLAEEDYSEIMDTLTNTEKRRMAEAHEDAENFNNADAKKYIKDMEREAANRWLKQQDDYETKVYGSDVREADARMKEVFGDNFQYSENPWDKDTKGPGAIQKQYGLKDVRNEADVYDFMEGRLGTEDFEFSMQRGGESQETIDKIVRMRNTAERLKNEYQKTAADNLAKARAEAAKQQKAWDDKVRNIQIDTAISKYQKYGKDLNKLREEQSKYDWQSEEYKAIGANITEVAKKRTALKKEALTKFNESMPDDEMYKVAEEISGVKGLTFTKKMHTNYENREYPVYESNDISDKAGVFGNVIKSARIETFNSSLSLDEETGEPHYWGTMSLRYESKNGGSNGMELMDIRYDRKSGWQIKDASGYIYQNGKKLSTVSQMKQYFIDRGYSASSAQDMATEYINNRIVR